MIRLKIVARSVSVVGAGTSDGTATTVQRPFASNVQVPAIGALMISSLSDILNCKEISFQEPAKLESPPPPITISSARFNRCHTSFLFDAPVSTSAVRV